MNSTLQPGVANVALITGASRGLGAQIARALASTADLALVAREQQALEKVAAALGSAGRKITTHAADLRETGAIDALFADVLQRHGRLDILVNNAAMQGPIGPMEGADFESWRAVFDLNLFAPVRLSQLLVRHLRERGSGGKIINISGGGATSPRPHFSAYGASKTALVRLTETLSVEVRADRIDVNAIAPGPMNTRMLDEVLAAGPTAAPLEYEAAAARHRAGGASPEAAAELVAFLASPASDGITGRLLSAVWDDWKHLRPQDLSETDLYTLRRVAPKR